MSIYGRMYATNQNIPSKEIINNKSPSRVLGGMKAAGVTSSVVEVDGSDLHIPRIEYVEALEKQIKELRNELKETKVRIIKLNNSINSIKNELRQNY